MKYYFSILMLLLCWGIIITSCGPLDIFYPLIFNNKSDKEIYIIVDMDSQDEKLTIGSECYHCNPETEIRLLSKYPWGNVVKDSIYLYIIDASMIDLPTEEYLSLESAERITQEMVLSRIIFYHSDAAHSPGFPSVCYP